MEDLIEARGDKPEGVRTMRRQRVGVESAVFRHL